ncbi:hypothetical protein WG66_007375, partial [Moniliophthora roreri]
WRKHLQLCPMSQGEHEISARLLPAPAELYTVLLYRLREALPTNVKNKTMTPGIEVSLSGNIAPASCLFHINKNTYSSSAVKYITRSAVPHPGNILAYRVEGANINVYPGTPHRLRQPTSPHVAPRCVEAPSLTQPGSRLN